ncbi:glucose-6-phosphate isomerase [Candidatus Brocadia sinica JPN1]|uniref:Glucose-6-phosphate isomerase n=1 Tax=Candidatus Brocadia sinica JPN1 TaxID=1197129 RepID=A0ABQ0JUW7_9BACT|nr:glucose-6-phosphate isomerase [Candidatus Brocadia sinica JPN1]
MIRWRKVKGLLNRPRAQFIKDRLLGKKIALLPKMFPGNIFAVRLFYFVNIIDQWPSGSS